MSRRYPLGDIVPDQFGVGRGNKGQRTGGSIQFYGGPGQTPQHDERPGPGPGPVGFEEVNKPRIVTCAEYFWLNMAVPFTSTAGEQKQASTDPKQFPLYVMGAWTNLAEPRAQFVGSASGVPLSTQQVLLASLAGKSDKNELVHFWRKPYLLRGQTSLVGNFTNDGGEAAGQVVFHCERPDRLLNVPVLRSQEYVLHLALGLNGSASQTGSEPTQSIEYDLLIYGAVSNVEEVTVRFVDSSNNNAWSTEQLPIGAFAGLTGESQQIMYYRTPYYLPAQSTLIAEFSNVGGENDGFIEFLCERILPA